MSETISRIVQIVFFLFCLFLVVFFQRSVGRFDLFMQLLGLAGLLFLLWNYNRKFT